MELGRDLAGLTGLQVKQHLLHMLVLELRLDGVLDSRDRWAVAGG
jgi:hypothetical protein